MGIGGHVRDSMGTEGQGEVPGPLRTGGRALEGALRLFEMRLAAMK